VNEQGTASNIAGDINAATVKTGSGGDEALTEKPLRAFRVLVVHEWCFE